MKKHLKKLSVLLSMAVLVSSMPFGAFATGTCSHPAENSWYLTEVSYHQLSCGDCGAQYGTQDAHTDTDADGRCNVCSVGVTNNTHKHNWSTDWSQNNYNTEHFHKCTDSACTMSTDTHNAVDDDGDGVCDICNYCLHTAKTDANDKVVFEIWHENHNKICQSCGETFDHGVHTAGADGYCTVCGALLDANRYHEHNYIWNNTAATHHATCSSCSMVISGNHIYDSNIWVVETDRHFQFCQECGMNSGYSAHTDTNKDGKCDSCKVSVASDANNTLVHTHTSNGKARIAEVLDHLTECTDCNSGYWEEHYDNTGDDLCDICNEPIHHHTKRTNGDGSYVTVIGEDVHYFVCDSCNNKFDPQPHTDGADDENGRCDVCFSPVTQDSSGNYIHTHTPHPDGLFANSRQHFNRCDTCGMTEYNYAYHTDTDTDYKCDGCGVSVTFSNGSYEHSCDSYEWMYEDEHYHIYKCPECDNSQAVQPHIDNCNNAYTTVTTPDGLCDVCDVTVQTVDGLITHIHQPDGNWQEINSDIHSCECTECGNWVDAPHEDTDMDGKCDDCEGTVTHNMNGYRYHEITKADGTVAKGHAKFCYWCGGIDETTFVEHTAETPVLNGFGAIPDDVTQHAKYCAECNGIVAGTEEKHTDTDGDGWCDGCGINVDANCVHTHEYIGYKVGEDIHYQQCSTCDFITSKESHTADSNSKCSVCKATLVDGKHFHTETVVGKNEMVHHIACGDCQNMLYDVSHSDSEDNDGYCDVCGISVDSNNIHHHTPDEDWMVGAFEHYCECTECDDIVVEKHQDNGSGVCTICNNAFDTSSGALDAAQLAAAEAAFNAAFAKAVNGDTADLEKLLSKEYSDILVEIYNDLKKYGDNTATYLTDEITFIGADYDNSKVKELVELFNTSTNNKLKANKLVVFDICVGFEADYDRNYWSLDKYLSSQKFDFTVNLNKNDVKTNRVWHLYVMDTTESEPAFTKVLTTAKGAAEFKVSGDNFFNEIYVLAYEDVTTPTSTPTPAPTATPTVAPTATAKPTAKPTATPTATPTPEASEEPVELPKEADTTIAEVVVEEAVAEAVKETVTVTEGTATVDKAAVEAVVQATEEDAPVVLPLTQAAGEGEVVNKAEVDTEALTAVAEEEKDVVIQLTDVTVKLDAKAVQAITEQAEGKTIEIRAVKTETSTLTQAQQNKLKDVETAIVISAQVYSDGEYIGKFKGGKATVMLPFEIEEGRDAKDYTVYYVDEKGDMHKVASEYVNGNMVFTTSHFSEYAIVYQPQTQAETETEVVVTPQEPAQSGGGFPILALVIALAVVVLGAVVFAKRRKTE